MILISDMFHSQVTIEGLCQHYGLNQSEAVSVIYKAVKIARESRVRRKERLTKSLASELGLNQ